MKFLNSEGLRMVLSKIKDKFATKEELQELAKKSSGGGYEEVVVQVMNTGNRFYFKLIKIGRRVDVFQILNNKDVLDELPPKFLPTEKTFVGRIFDVYTSGFSYNMENSRLLTVAKRLNIDGKTHISIEVQTWKVSKSFNYIEMERNIKQIYIGSYITKE